MTNIVKFDFENIHIEFPVLEYKGQRVLLTEQVAELYGTKEHNIRKNFNRNNSKFEEGKHYFKLEGSECVSLVTQVILNYPLVFSGKNLKHITHLTLWTKNGIILHAKMLKTDSAWNISNSEKSKIIYTDLYVIQFDNGIIKIGKSNNIYKRIQNHKDEAARYGVNILRKFTKLHSVITENELIAYCKGISTLFIGNEYFKNLNFNSVVDFLNSEDITYDNPPIIPDLYSDNNKQRTHFTITSFLKLHNAKLIQDSLLLKLSNNLILISDKRKISVNKSECSLREYEYDKDLLLEVMDRIYPSIFNEAFSKITKIDLHVN